MHTTAAVLATVLVVALVVVQPLVGRRRYGRLVARVRADPGARRRHYLRGIVGEWLSVGVVAVIGALAGADAASIGLTVGPLPPGAATIAVEFVVLSVVGLAVSTAVVWWGGPGVLDVARRQVRGFVELLPRTSAERAVFAGLALTAGICEEILYRGFGIAYVHWLLPGASRATVIVTIGAAFGLAHLYQGPRNVVLTGLVGGLFAWVTLATGTLLPVIVVHALVDLRIVCLPPALAERPAPRPPAVGVSR